MEILTKFTPSFRLVLFFFALPFFGMAQQFPVNNQKIVQGVGTAAQGISSYSSAPPTVNPSATTWRHVSSLHMDTVAQVQYIYKRPRWYPISVVRSATPPPATAASGSTTIDYTESIWQSTADSLTYYYEEENACWQPVGTYISSTTPSDVAATGSTGAICYGYGLWYDPDIDTIYAQQGSTWTAIGAGGGGDTVTASNGLTKTGNDIKLGGTLTGATTITGAGYDFTETGLGYYNFEADSAIWKINGQKFLHMGSLTGASYTRDELAVGYRAGANLPTSGSIANTLFGSYAGEGLNGTNQDGASNAFFGYTAGQTVTTGSYNSFFGVAAGAGAGATMNRSTGLGYHALINASGDSNTGVGNEAVSKATGGANTGTGLEALKNTTSGAYNTADGAQALSSNITGHSNTVGGHQSFFSNTAGSRNIGLGRNSGNVALGDDNIFIGYDAGATQTTGNKNIILAYGGALSSITASNELNIGSAIYGTGLNAGTKVGLFGINEATPIRTLHVTLNNALTNTAGIGLRLAGQTSGTAAAGFGVLSETVIENASGTNVIAATAGAVFTDATNATEDADYVVNLMDAGSAAAEKFRVDSDGNIKPAAGYKDTSGDLGTLGQRFSSTGTGTNWVSDTTTVMLNDSIIQYKVAGLEVGRDTIRTSGSGGGGGSGTVTSVGLSLPSIFSVSGSPVTTSGTLTGTLATQTANTIFAGPTTGAAAEPTFRAMVEADLPTYDAGRVMFTDASGKPTEDGGFTRDATTGGVLISGTGAGTTAALQVRNPSANISYINITDNSTGPGPTNGLLFGYNGGALVYNRENTPMYIATNDLTRITIANGAAADGFVSIGKGTSVATRLLDVRQSTALTNSINYSLRIGHITSGTATTGLGAGMEFTAESAGGTERVSATIENPYTTATNAAEVSDLVFKTMRAGTLTEAGRFLGAGGLTVSTTGSGVSGVTATSSTLYGVNATSTAGTAAYYGVTENATTNTLLLSQYLARQTTGTAANGIGQQMTFATETTASTPFETNSIKSLWTDATHASRTSQLVFTGVSAATQADIFTLEGNGQVKANTYGVGTHTGTAARNLQVTSAGAVIEKALPAYGEASIFGTQTLAFLAGSTTYDTLSGYTSGELSGFSLVGGALKYTGTETIKVQVTVSMSLTFAEAGQVFAGIRQNTTNVTKSRAQQKIDTAADVNNIAITCILTLATNDLIRIELAPSAHTGDDNITVSNCNFNITEI